MSYVKVDVTPDTPEWEEERRKSVGASEVAAVMSMSSYGVTPLDVYKHKQGADRQFDPLLAWIGHQSEPIMDAWLREFSGLDLEPMPGFMARSVEWPFLHASFDRVAEQPLLTVQFKTATAWAGHRWDEGIPTDIRVQVQAEMAVAGTPRALVVVWIGGREFRYFWEPRDDRFIHEHMIPTVERFWDANVRAGVAPDPATVAEIQDRFPSASREVDLSDAAFETLERITVLNSDIKAQSEERDALKVALAGFVQDADTLMRDGRKVATWKSQAGRVGFDKTAFGLDHPHLLAKYTYTGEPFKVLRRISRGERT